MTAYLYSLQSGTVGAAMGGSGAASFENNGRSRLADCGELLYRPHNNQRRHPATGRTATLGSGNVTINPGGVLNVTSYGSGGYTFGGMLTAGRTAAFATDINGNLNVTSAALAQASSNSKMTISGSLTLTSGTVNFLSGDTISLIGGGALTQGGNDFVNLLTSVGTGTYTLFTGSSVPANPASYLTLVGDTSSRQNYAFNVSGNTAMTTHRHRGARQPPLDRRKQPDVGYCHIEKLVQSIDQRRRLLLYRR